MDVRPYKNVIDAVTWAASAGAIDNTARADLERDQVDVSTGLRKDPQFYAAMVHARLSRTLPQALWDALLAKYSSCVMSRAQAIERLWPSIVSPADRRFTRYAAVAWAFPRSQGNGKRSTALLPSAWYDINVWDPDARSETTRRRWNSTIRNWLENTASLALVEAQSILEEEGLLKDAA